MNDLIFEFVQDENSHVHFKKEEKSRKRKRKSENQGSAEKVEQEQMIKTLERDLFCVSSTSGFPKNPANTFSSHFFQVKGKIEAIQNFHKTARHLVYQELNTQVQSTLKNLRSQSDSYSSPLKERICLLNIKIENKKKICSLPGMLSEEEKQCELLAIAEDEESISFLKDFLFEFEAENRYFGRYLEEEQRFLESGQNISKKDQLPPNPPQTLNGQKWLLNMMKAFCGHETFDGMKFLELWINYIILK